MNRRAWIKTAGGLVVGFTVGGVPAFAGQAVPAAASGNDGRPLDPKEVDSFLSIHPDGSVTVYTSKVDVGTGMRIAIAQAGNDGGDGGPGKRRHDSLHGKRFHQAGQ